MTNNVVFWGARTAISGPKEITAALKVLGTKHVDFTPNGRRRRIFTRRKAGSTYAVKPNDLIVNWGNKKTTDWNYRAGLREEDLPTILNNPYYVGKGSNKLLCLRQLVLNGVPCVPYTENYLVADEWHQDESIVVGRTTLNGHSGQGIILFGKANGYAQNVREGTPCPLYTKYIKKTQEYRAHVFNGTVIDLVQKRLKKEGAIADTRLDVYKIRNHARGWVFCHDMVDVKHRGGLEAIAIDAVKACGLDFGAVDIIYNSKADSYYVLEINTAPGLSSPTTIAAYTNAIAGVLSHDEN